MSRRTRAFALTLSGCLLCAAAAMAGSNYKLIKTIDLPGSKGGHGDWVAYDSPSKTVWLAQSPDNNIVVVDTGSMAVKAVVAGIANANGIAISANYAFAADPDKNLLVVIDKNTLKTVASLKPQGKTPDGVVYDPAEIYPEFGIKPFVDAPKVQVPKS